VALGGLLLCAVIAAPVVVGAQDKAGSPPPTEKTAPTPKGPEADKKSKPAAPSGTVKPKKGTFQPSEKIPADVPSTFPTDI
jgi:hypothetical protein